MCRLAGVSYGGQEREGRPSWQRREQEQPCDAWAERGGLVWEGWQGAALAADQPGSIWGTPASGFFFFLSVLATPKPLEVIRQVFLEQQKPSSWISQKGGGRD